MGIHRQKEKLVISSLAGMALSLLSYNVKSVEAAKIPLSEQGKAENVESQKSQNSFKLKTDNAEWMTKKQEEVGKTNLVESDSQEESSSNHIVNNSPDSGSVIQDKEQSSNEKTESLKRSNTTDIMWNGLTLSYDNNSQTLMIPGSSTPINDPETLVDVLNDRTVTKIIIENPLKITGSAERLFGNLGDLKSIEGLEKLDTSEVTSMATMFVSCSSLEALNLSNFKTTNVEDMFAMFSDCYRLKKINLSSFNTANVENMEQMFNECRDLEELDLSSFNTAKVTDMGEMFHFCTSLKKLNVSSFNTAKVESMFSMFTECNNLKELDLKNFETTSDPDMDEMFKRCYRLEKVDISGFNFENPDNNRLGDSFFQLCISLNTLVLGPGMPNLENGHIHDDPADPLYNAKWINTGTNPSLPRGTHIWTSEEFVENYQGSQDYDTYIILAQPVTVHYQDTAGKKLAPDKIIDNYGINEELTIQPINLSNYLINSIKVNGGQISSISEAKIKFGKTAQEVTFIYQENQPEKPQPAKTATVIVHYQDEAGNALASDTILTGRVGDGYITDALAITGYTLKERPVNATGVFSTQTQIVTYVYTKIINTSQASNHVQSEEHNLKTVKKPKLNSEHEVKKQGHLPVAERKSSTLPHTGTDYLSNVAILILGASLLLTSLIAIKRKQKNN